MLPPLPKIIRKRLISLFWTACGIEPVNESFIHNMPHIIECLNFPQSWQDCADLWLIFIIADKRDSDGIVVMYQTVHLCEQIVVQSLEALLFGAQPTEVGAPITG